MTNKVVISVLRNWIRNCIIQEGLNFDTSEKLGLLVHPRGDGTTYALFRFNETMDYLMEKGYGTYQMTSAELAKDLVYSGTQDRLIGLVRCYNPWEKTHLGAAEVKLSSAEDGWGPTLYDLAMGEEDRGIMADRSEVSPEAFRIWDYYLKHRDDIIKSPLDSYEHQWTDDTFDDGYPGSSGEYGKYNLKTHEEFLEDPTCWVYDREPVPQAAGWKKNGEIIKGLLISIVGSAALDDFMKKLEYHGFDYRRL